MNDWNAHKQGSTQKVDEYIRDQKDFHRRLIALGHNFGDEHRKMRLLYGLNQKFAVDAKLYRRDRTMTFYQICDDLRIAGLWLLAYGLKLPPASTIPSSESHTAL